AGAQALRALRSPEAGETGGPARMAPLGETADV
ncbi:MAG: hypothetical protein RLZ83_883, partial [Pseudomonadota bacterium]